MSLKPFYNVQQNKYFVTIKVIKFNHDLQEYKF